MNQIEVDETEDRRVTESDIFLQSILNHTRRNFDSSSRFDRTDQWLTDGRFYGKPVEFSGVRHGGETPRHMPGARRGQQGLLVG